MGPSLANVEFLPSGRRVRVQVGKTILEAAREAGETLAAPCGGAGLCGGCLVRIATGLECTMQQPSGDGTHLYPGRISNNMGTGLSERGFRLACRTAVLGDVSVYVPQFSTIETQVVLKAPRRTRFRPVKPVRPNGGLGLALDVGSTTLAAYLCDMPTGRLLDWASAVNPQTVFGEDILTRVQAAVADPPAASAMHNAAIQTVQSLLVRLCRRCGLSHTDVTDMAMVGNPVMHHLFLGLDVSPLGRAPFRPSLSEALTIPLSHLGLEAARGSLLYAPPLVDGFVGSDNLAATIATGLNSTHHTALLIDLGTNGEVALTADASVFSTSCATGPAFEGAHLTFGTRAIPGAVEHLQIDSLAWEPLVQLVPQPDDAARSPNRAIGLCGSGIISAIAELVRCGTIGKDGRFVVADHTRLRQGPHGSEFILVWASDSALGEDITVSARDVRAVQLAVSAVRAGTAALLRAAGRAGACIESMYIAGAFGTRLHVPSAVRLGLLPPAEPGRVHFVGNAAGEGACMLLLDQASRREAERLGHSIRHVDLLQDSLFAKDFVEFLRFP